MSIIQQLKRELTQATARWHQERSAKAHGAMTAARCRLQLVRLLIREGMLPAGTISRQ